jgi:dGTP triphosphohydrolase
MGADSRDRIENDGVHRAVADYIAGMTDCFAMKEYSRIFL